MPRDIKKWESGFTWISTGELVAKLNANGLPDSFRTITDLPKKQPGHFRFIEGDIENYTIRRKGKGNQYRLDAVEEYIESKKARA
jgi:hypothetical protein